MYNLFDTSSGFTTSSRPPSNLLNILFSLPAPGLPVRGLRSPDLRARSRLSIVLEAPIPNRSFGDETSLYVMNGSSDKQQLSHKIGWPVTHMHKYMRPGRASHLRKGTNGVSTKWGHCTFIAFRQRGFLGIPVNLLLPSQQCQGVPFSPICRN